MRPRLAPRRRTLLLALVAACALPRAAAGQAPHLDGTVEIDLPRGVLTGDVCLSGLPGRDTASFLLNHGLNIVSVRDVEGRSLEYRGYHDGEMVGEGLHYTVPEAPREPRTLCIHYTGAFPVHDVRAGEYRAFDFKGLIAFNGFTLRAAEQSKWYPVAYEPATERLHERVSYRLRVRCPACRAVYVNGAEPAGGPEVEMASESPYAPFLFAGDFGYVREGATLYVNSDLSLAPAAVLSAKVAEIRGYYQALLGLPFGDAPVFLEHRSVERMREGRSWGFVTWPTIAVAGTGIADLMRAQPRAWGFLAHEMGHYYFGTLLEPRGTYRWFFLESVAEYLSLRVVDRFLGHAAYRIMLRERYDDARAAPTPPRLDRITDPEAIDERYRYRYGPLLLVALEHEIGTEAMSRLLRALVTAPPDAVVDYDYLARAALKAGASPEAWGRFERECVQRPPDSSCLAWIGE